MFRANFGISFTSLEYWSDYNENLRSVVTTINRRTDYILAELVPRKSQQDMKENSNRCHSEWLHKFDNTYGMLRPHNWRVHWTHAAAEASYDCTVFNSLVFCDDFRENVGQTPQRIFTVDSLEDADLRKDVPFGGLDDK